MDPSEYRRAAEARQTGLQTSKAVATYSLLPPHPHLSSVASTLVLSPHSRSETEEEKGWKMEAFSNSTNPFPHQCISQIKCTERRWAGTLEMHSKMFILHKAFFLVQTKLCMRTSLVLCLGLAIKTSSTGHTQDCLDKDNARVQKQKARKQKFPNTKKTKRIN